MYINSFHPPFDAMQDRRLIEMIDQPGPGPDEK